MMGLPYGRRSFKIGLVVLIQYRLWQTDRHPASQPARHVAVATCYAYLRRAIKNSHSGWTAVIFCHHPSQTFGLLKPPKGPDFFTPIYTPSALQSLTSLYTTVEFRPDIWSLCRDAERNYFNLSKNVWMGKAQTIACSRIFIRFCSYHPPQRKKSLPNFGKVDLQSKSDWLR